MNKSFIWSEGNIILSSKTLQCTEIPEKILGTNRSKSFAHKARKNVRQQ
jgi:hypothetical protein